MDLLVLLWGFFGFFCAYYHYIYYGYKSPVYASLALFSALVTAYGLLNSEASPLAAFLPLFVFVSLTVAAGPRYKLGLLTGGIFMCVIAFKLDHRPWNIVLAIGALIYTVATVINFTSLQSKKIS